MAIGDQGIQLKPINTGWAEEVEAEAEEEKQPLSPEARMFHSPRLNCFIVAVMGCTVPANLDIIKHGLAQTLIKHPRFSSKLIFDAKEPADPIAWIRTKVNLDDHVTVPDLDPNMDSPDQFVEDYVSNLSKTPMDMSKPLWEFHLLNVKTSAAASTGVFRIHHSIGDGISIISLLLACTRKGSDPDALPSLPTPKKKKESSYPLLLRYLFVTVLFFKILWNSLVDLVLFLATVTFLKDTKTPLKGDPGIERTPKRFVHRVLSLDDIKLVKNATNATINDVVLGITQAGLSCYLNQKHGKVGGDEKAQQDNLPKNIRLRATVVVNLRATTAIKGLAKMMEGGFKEGVGWGNAIGYILVPFHIALRDDPLDYIRDAKAIVDRKKQSLEAQLTNSSVKLLQNTLGLGASVTLTYNALSNTTMCFSNVLGPVEEISFYGHPLAFVAPSVYGLPQALVIHFQSYVDKMILVMAVDEDVIPDPHKLCDDIEKSLKLAKDAISKRSS